MQNKYCLPIITESWQKIVETIESNEPKYGYFEIWLDYLTNLNITELLQFINQYPGRVVLVFRRQKLEPIIMPLESRLELLKQLQNTDCLIDLAIPQQLDELEYTRDKSQQFKIIVSFHDYDKTPNKLTLDNLVKQMQDYNAYIAKIAVMCNDESDALTLLQLQQTLKRQGQKHIILGMGDAGKITRVYGTLWGNELAFVPGTMAEASDPGQFTLEQFDNIMRTLKGNN